MLSGALWSRIHEQSRTRGHASTAMITTETSDATGSANRVLREIIRASA